LETGFVYAFNEQRLYYSASLNKAPYALYLYETLEDLDTVHIYTEDMYREGAGIIKKMEPGAELTDAELLEYAVRLSDNVAFRMLIRVYGVEGFKVWLNEKGMDTTHIRNLTNANLTVLDAAFITQLLYKYIESPGERNAKLKMDLLTSAFPYIQTGYPFAHKYGLWDEAHHDMGIIYAPSPYILVVMTDRGSSEEPVLPETRVIFWEISAKIQEVNDYLIQRAFTIHNQGRYHAL
jgi:beta-lactamase class A